jgi:hypothetical protein
MIQGEHIISRFALESIQILHCKDVFHKLELEAWTLSDQPFHVRLIQKIINFLFVHLQVAAVDSVAFAPQIRFLFDHVIDKVDRARDNTLIVSRFNIGRWDSLIIHLILVAFHCEGLA